jgi:hypothetical protein
LPEDGLAIAGHEYVLEVGNEAFSPGWPTPTYTLVVGRL